MTKAAFAGAAMAIGGCKCPFGGHAERVPYGDTIGDRLWMWGHHRDSFKALKGRKDGYNLPYDTRIDMAAPCLRTWKNTLSPICLTIAFSRLMGSLSGMRTTCVLRTSVARSGVTSAVRKS